MFLCVGVSGECVLKPLIGQDMDRSTRDSSAMECLEAALESRVNKQENHLKIPSQTAISLG